MKTDDIELKAMTSIWDALQTLPDDDSRTRCLKWAIGRLGLNLVSTGPIARPADAPAALPVLPTTGGGDSMEDIVEPTEDGRFRVIARDLKARSKNDAAIRLTYLLLYANEILGGQAKASSRKLVVPVLQEWRAYDGNTRGALSKDHGLKRDGDLLSLDIHSRREAQNYITQIRDESTKGSWTPSGVRNRKPVKKAASKAGK